MKAAAHEESIARQEELLGQQAAKIEVRVGVRSISFVLSGC